MKSDLLTRKECAALRGIAIIGIFLHNFSHWLPGIVRENEYTFKISNVEALDYAFANPDWNLPLHLLSFFGHYGVPVFLFLSAYGLVMKYEQSVAEYLSPLKFLKRHYLKLFQMMIVGFAFFTMVDAFTPGRHHYALLDVVAQLLMFNNVLPNPDHIIWPGPYWFFGLMMQLYVVYRLALYRRHWAVTAVLMVVSTLILFFCEPSGEAMNRWRYNCIGGMLPFGAGILYARYGAPMTRKLYAIMLPLGIISIYLCSGDFLNWLLVPLMVVFTGICLVKAFPESWLGGLVWMGGISAALFVCHPIARKIFIPIARTDGLYTGLLLYIIASLILAVAFNYMIKLVRK